MEVSGSGSVRVENCEFADNVATGSGGAIFASGDSNVTVTNSTFLNNRANVRPTSHVAAAWRLFGVSPNVFAI